MTNDAAMERRIAGFADRYTRAIAAPLRDKRQRLRAHFPRGVAMVFDNDNALAFLEKPGVAALIAQANETRRDALVPAGPLSTVIEAEVEKQRPRRPASTQA